MKVTFLPKGPALMIENKKAVLVIADLHMGIESELRNKGVHFRSRGRERTEKIISIIKDTAPETVILLGDVKHRIPGTSLQEFKEVPTLFESIRKYAQLRVAPGNHDPGIEKFLHKEELLSKRGVLIDGTGYMHGHTKPAHELYGHLIVCGHHHPTISLFDEVGCALKTPCFLLAELDKSCFEEKSNPDFMNENKSRVLFVPAFNEFSGYGIERTIKKPFSAISKAIVKETAEIILPDGTYAGPLLSLIKNEN